MFAFLIIHWLQAKLKSNFMLALLWLLKMDMPLEIDVILIKKSIFNHLFAFRFLQNPIFIEINKIPFA